ncbi:MAG: YceI family protein [Nitrospinae bacterium]|nr:YceI family protein [Nitrospinota bacterium]
MKKEHSAKQFFILSLVFVAATTFGLDGYGEAKEHIFSPENTKVGFRLDSTLHRMVSGTARKFNGKVAIPRGLDPKGYYTEIIVSVKDMDTANEDRDKKMHETCFEAGKNPDIIFRSTEFKNFPARLEKGKEFEFLLVGNLTIKGVTKNVAIPVKVQYRANGYSFHGTVWLNYLQDFNIPDPSVFIFRVAKRVEVFFETDIPSSLFESRDAVSQ